MDAQWPASRSYETYHRVHDALLADSDAEFRALLNQKATGSAALIRDGDAARQYNVNRSGRAVR
jgi:hypothetical protein